MTILKSFKPALRYVFGRLAYCGYQIIYRKKRQLNFFTQKHAAHLREAGFVRVEGVLSAPALSNLLQSFKMKMCNPRSFAAVYRHHAATPLQVATESFDVIEVWPDVDWLRERTAYLKFRDPLVEWPEIMNIILVDEILDIATAYLGAAPALTGCTYNVLFANCIAPMEAQRPHCDGNSPRFLKVFAYLQDTPQNLGPTHYYSGSNHLGVKKRLGSYRKAKDDSLVTGLAEPTPLEALLGDVVLADTSGLHYGGKPRAADRYMITLNLSIHPEYFSNYSKHKSLRIRHVNAGWFQRLVDRGVLRYADVQRC